MGYLLSYWMGIEKTVYASVDMPDVLHDVVDQINDNVLKCVDLVCQRPAEVIMTGDNLSSDVQPPSFFRTWSEPFYREAFRRIKAAGKFSTVHVDGRLRGLLKAMADAGASGIDAVTPADPHQPTRADAAYTCRSRYWIASVRCAGSIHSAPAKSAIVRASSSARLSCHAVT